MQNLHGVVFLRAVATEPVAPPPPDADAVHPEPPRARIRSPGISSLLSPHFPSRSRAVEPANPNPRYAAALLDVRRRLAGVAGHHCRIAATSRCASTSSTSTPSHASRNAVVESPSSIYRRYTGRCSSPIPPSPVSLRPRRPLHLLHGELAHVLDHFPLSIRSRVVV